MNKLHFLAAVALGGASAIEYVPMQSDYIRTLLLACLCYIVLIAIQVVSVRIPLHFKFTI